MLCFILVKHLLVVIRLWGLGLQGLISVITAEEQLQVATWHFLGDTALWAAKCSASDLKQSLLHTQQCSAVGFSHVE